MFITGPEAVSEMTKNDALIIVDCNRASYTEYPELVRRAQCIIVFDHHRQTTDCIDNAQLSYVELSSSSTCEMVVEIIQYINETVKLQSLTQRLYMVALWLILTTLLTVQVSEPLRRQRTLRRMVRI